MTGGIDKVTASASDCSNLTSLLIVKLIRKHIWICPFLYWVHPHGILVKYISLKIPEKEKCSTIGMISWLLKRGWSKMIFLKDQQGNQKVQAFLLVPHNMAACGAIIRLGWSPPLNINIGNLCLTRPCHGAAAAATRSLQLPRKVWHNCLPANANAFMAWHASATSSIRTLILFIVRLYKVEQNTQKDEDFKISNKDTENIMDCIVGLAPILLIARLYFPQTLQDQAGAWTWPPADTSGAVEYAGGCWWWSSGMSQAG